MTTLQSEDEFKDEFFSPTDYSNVNLNQNRQSFHINHFNSTISTNNSSQKYGRITESGGFQTDDSQPKTYSNPWSKNHFSSNIWNSEKQNEFKKAKYSLSNNNTVSLHIENYENSNKAADNILKDVIEKEGFKKEKENLIKNWKNSKQFLVCPDSVFLNPFEFPRQQENETTQADVFNDMIRYAWFASGYFDERPEKFETPVTVCFDSIKIDSKCHCGKRAFITCAHCDHFYCFHHFVKYRHRCYV